MHDALYPDTSSQERRDQGALILVGDTRSLPTSYTAELFQAVFEHVYESYVGDGRSVYAEVA